VSKPYRPGGTSDYNPATSAGTPFGALNSDRTGTASRDASGFGGSTATSYESGLLQKAENASAMPSSTAAQYGGYGSNAGSAYPAGSGAAGNVSIGGSASGGAMFR